MRVLKISENIGVEITGMDLRKPVDAATKQRLHDLVVENIAMVIRGQQLTPEQFQEAAKVFGELTHQTHPKYSFPGMPGIKRHSSFNLAADGKQLKEGLHWHTDGNHRPDPPKFTILYAVELPSSGYNTSVVNMRAAYRALPEQLRKELEAMQTVNVRLALRARSRHNPNNIAVMAEGGQVPTIHPLVRTNADNGEKSLWFNPTKVDYIVGMDADSTQDFLRELMDRTILPPFIYSHQWKLGDVLIWDTRQSMHKTDFQHDPSQHRLHYHAMTKGGRPH